MERAEVALRVRGVPVVCRIDAAVWKAWGQSGPIECVLEPLADDGAGADAPAGSETWIRLKDAAAMLAADLGDVSRKGKDAAYGRLMHELRKRNGSRIKDNGMVGPMRRIDQVSFDAWRLKQRDKALKEDGWGDGSDDD